MFKCVDCPEAIGYDLCLGCMKRGVHKREDPTGRFNQTHRPDHTLEEREQVSCEPRTPNTLVQAPLTKVGSNHSRFPRSTFLDSQERTLLHEVAERNNMTPAQVLALVQEHQSFASEE